MSHFSETPLTVIDPDTQAVELPLHVNLEWFDKLRSGVVGVVTLVPDQEGGWTILIQPAQGMVDQAVEALKHQQEGENSDG